MRELFLFLGCVMLALGVWGWSRDREVVGRRQAERRLVGLGAADGLTPSPERSLLTGDFLIALQSTPSPETYARLAPVFLVSHELGKDEAPRVQRVRAYAYTKDLMARVLGDTLQFFDPTGRSLQPSLMSLESGKPLLTAQGEAELRADGDWIVSRQGQQYGAFRPGPDGLVGFTANQAITAEHDTLTVGGAVEWRWNGQTVERVEQP